MTTFDSQGQPTYKYGFMEGGYGEYFVFRSSNYPFPIVFKDKGKACKKNELDSLKE
jgi:hypothetical protein